MTNFKILFCAAICCALCLPFGEGEVLLCGKGSLNFSPKDNAQGFINFNCGDFPLTASFPSQNSDRCFSNGRSTLRIVTRSGWNAKPDATPQKLRTKPADCILADGHSYIIDDNNFVGRMQTDQEHQNKEFGSYLDNFIVGDNGRVYEALGWDSYNEIRGGGLNCLRIAFVKKSRLDAASPQAVLAYESLVKTAICLGKLTPHYKLIPYYLINNKYLIEASSFERNEMRRWKNYNANPDLGDGLFDKKHSIVFRDEWSLEKPAETWLNYTSPVKYVAIGNYYQRCFRNCLPEVRWREKDIRKKKEDVHINFHIMDDGLAYESYGWDHTWTQYWVNKMAVSIDFVGQFHSYLPSEKALKCLSHLLRMGVIWGKLSPDYEIVSYRKINDNKEYIGVALQEAIAKIPRYTENFE